MSAVGREREKKNPFIKAPRLRCVWKQTCRLLWTADVLHWTSCLLALWLMCCWGWRWSSSSLRLAPHRLRRLTLVCSESLLSLAFQSAFMERESRFCCHCGRKVVRFNKLNRSLFQAEVFSDSSTWDKMFSPFHVHRNYFRASAHSFKSRSVDWLLVPTLIWVFSWKFSINRAIVYVSHNLMSLLQFSDL